MRIVAFVSLAFCAALVGGVADLAAHPNWYLLDHEQCGESVSDRIIGGTRALLGEFPWMARIGYVKTNKRVLKPPTFKCGASLISSMYVATAAHCVRGIKNEIVAVVRLGEHDTRTNIDCEADLCAPPIQDFQPTKIIVHEKYEMPPMRNDIALIRLSRPVNMNAYVSPICLPYGPLLQKDYMNSSMEVAGWGVSNVKLHRGSDVLLHVRVPIVNPKFCDQTLGKFATTGPGQLCAGGEVGYDSCAGDSGGPLMKPEAVDGPPKYFLIGVVSFGTVKCGSHAPAVYTDLPKYMTWILDNIEP